MNVSVDQTPVAIPAARPGGRVALLALGTFAVGTDAFVVAGFLPAISAGLDVSLALAGQSVTVFAVTYALASPIIATLTASVPRRRLLVSALGVLALANLASALAPDIVTLMVSRIVAGIGAAAFTPNAAAVAAGLVPEARRGRALAVVVGGLSVSTAVGVPLGHLAAEWLGWRMALGAVSGLCVLAALGLGIWLPRLEGGPRLPLGARLAVLRSSAVIKILPVTVLGMTAGYTAYAYAVPAFAAVGIAAGDSQWMLLLYGLGAIVGTRVSGQLTDRYGGERVLLAGYLVMACTLGTLGLLARGHVGVPMLVAVLAFAWGMTTWCQTPPQQHRLIAAAPDSMPIVTSLNASAIYVGIGLGSFAGGVADAAGMSGLFFCGAAFAVLTGAWLVVTRRGAGAGRAA